MHIATSQRLLPDQLKAKFIEVLKKENLTYQSGNPFLLVLERKKYLIFLKNLSPAYFKGLPNNTRIQIPYNEKFEKHLKTEIPFLFFGYDKDNDVLVSWNPEKVKAMINTNINNSLYSRLSLQRGTKGDEFNIGHLSNGDQFVLFKRSLLTRFFSEHNTLFLSSTKKISFTEHKADNLGSTSADIKADKKLVALITPYIRKNELLGALEACNTYHQANNLKFSVKDSVSLIHKLHNKMKSSS